MNRINRKSAPSVKNGRVQKKNNWNQTANYYNTSQDLPQVERQRPGHNYRHLLKQRDIHGFIALLPNWKEISGGLNAVVLAPGEWNTDGYHVPGVVHICAWQRELWTEHEEQFVTEHQDLLNRLGVPIEKRGKWYLLKWTEATARAYQLLHVFLHELGHHNDRMTTRQQRESCRGERFAEDYALKHEALIWERYLRVFGLS